MANVVVKCGWCQKDFPTESSEGKHGYGTKRCPHCGTIVNSSKIEYTGNLVGLKHIHSDLKTGDVV